MALAIGVMPFAISLLVCWVCTSWRQWLAVVLAIVTGAIFLFEIYSSSVGGNLTGLIWILSLPFVSIAVVALYVLEKVSSPLKRSESQGPSQSGDEQEPNNPTDRSSDSAAS
jgi:hypothetical protein